MATATQLLRITAKTRKSLDELKLKYEFTTMGDQLESMVNFFIVNKFNPRDLNFNNIESITFENRDKVIKKSDENTERIIKIIRNIELTKLDNTLNKIRDCERQNDNIQKLFMELFIKEKQKIAEENYLKNSTDQNTENSRIKELEFENKKLKDDIKEHYRCLETLNKSLKVVNDNGERKAYFKITIDEVHDLFYLVP